MTIDDRRGKALNGASERLWDRYHDESRVARNIAGNLRDLGLMSPPDALPERSSDPMSTDAGYDDVAAAAHEPPPPDTGNFRDEGYVTPS